MVGQNSWIIDSNASDHNLFVINHFLPRKTSFYNPCKWI